MEFVEGLLKKGDSYWQDPMGCGHGTFDLLLDGKRVKTMEITIKAERGVHIAVTERNPQTHQRFIAITGNKTTGAPVKVQYGGEPYFIPAAFFLTSQIAEMAMRVFISDGQKTTGVNWVLREELHWDTETGSWKSDRA
jgi:hypothetical protein